MRVRSIGMIGVAAASVLLAQSQPSFRRSEILEAPPDFDTNLGHLGYGNPRPMPVTLGRRRYNYEEPPPPPNPKADKRKANRVKQMQARKAQRKLLSGGK